MRSVTPCYRYSAAIFLNYKFGGPLSPGAPKHCFFCFYVNPALTSMDDQVILRVNVVRNAQYFAFFVFRTFTCDTIRTSVREGGELYFSKGTKLEVGQGGRSVQKVVFGRTFLMDNP